MSIRGSSRFGAAPLTMGAENLGSGSRSHAVGQRPLPLSGSLQSFHKVAEQIDDFLGEYAGPIKPYLPGIGRFLIVATFLEDGLRIISQWKDQVNYIWQFRGIPWILTVLYLVVNVACMFTGAFGVVFKKQLVGSVCGLVFVVVSQALVYGLFFDFEFFSRNISVLGGLVLVLSTAFIQNPRLLSLPGLPRLEDRDNSMYLQLAGRILLIFLFLAFLISKQWTFWGGVSNLFGLLGCALVAVGYKARFSASFLVILLSFYNAVTNDYWSYARDHPTRDYLRYEFFQTLSIIGGLLLLVSTGAGRLSIDEKRKIY